MREEVTSTDWFRLADLGCAATSGALLWLIPQTGPWALLLACLPWLLRLGRKRMPFQSTPLDIPIAIFLITAGVGAWASYNSEAALVKLWLMLASAFLFYAIAGQPPQNLRWVCALLSATGAVIAIYYLLTLDVGMLSIDLEIISRLVASWVAMRPQIGAPGPHPNIAGGLMALMAPYTLALLQEARRTRQVGLLIFTLVSGGIAALGLLMSSSRAAWLSLGAGLGFWSLWWLAGRLAGDQPARHRRIFTAIVALVLGLGMLLLVLYPGGPIRLFERLPGPDTTGSRLEIARGALRLVRDYPYTGGGLHAFAGLFSHYIIVIPFFFINYAHNLYLDLALEQGVAGLLAFLFILAGGGWLLARNLRPRGPGGAILASLVVLAVHGLADDPLYAGRGTPLLLLAPAMAVAISRGAGDAVCNSSDRSLPLRLAGVSLLLAAILFIAFRQPLLSGWYANLGAVRMAQVELAGFPTNQWDDGSRVHELAPAEHYFNKALRLDPSNTTAHHRLGLIAMLRRDYPSAQTHLEEAFAADRDHRGVKKNLAFTYVWNGQLDRAEEMMNGIPGVRGELEAYTGFWRMLDRPDLAEQAEQMLKRLP